jgi:hypothetical protein
MSIWVEVIWGKLGRKDYKIHEHSQGETAKLVVEWMKLASEAEIWEVLRESCDCVDLDIEKDWDYYDGPIHKIGPKFHVHYFDLLPLAVALFAAFPEELLKNIDLIKEMATILAEKRKNHEQEEKAD